jgi:hypothetical protein
MSFFNSMDKVEINNIKNLCASHILLKKGTYVIFIELIEGSSSNPKKLCLCTSGAIFFFF